MPTKKYEELKWQELTDTEKTDVIREAKRYCPEFPFEPDLVEKATNLTSFYTEDYQLMRLSVAGDQQQQVWGFYARGDFHPLDASGQAFEELNEIGPLHLNLNTVLDYTLLRLRFELHPRAVEHANQNRFRLAHIVGRPEDLPPGEVKNVKQQLIEPRVEMAPEWELIDRDTPTYTQRGLVFRVVAVAVVYHSETQWELIQAFVQIEPDGTLTIRLHHKKRRNERVTLTETVQPQVFVLSPQRTRTAMPIRKWEVPVGNEADVLLKLIETCHVETATEFHEGDLKDSVSLAKKLAQGSDPLSRYLQTRCSAETLNKWKGRTDLKSDTVEDAIVEILNQTLSDPSLFTEERFGKVILSEETRKLLAQKPASGRKLACLNRSLLEETYVNELFQRRIIVRLGELSFYPDCKLLEVLVTKPTGYRRGYAVVRMEDDKLRLHPLIGKSDVVHKLNKMTRLDLTEGKVNSYLQFFCWAIITDEGPFYVPLAFREIPLLVAPSINQHTELSRLDFSISNVAETEQKARGFDTSGGDYVLESQTAYGSQVFQTVFAISDAGMVNMLQDESRVDNLVIHKERYGDAPEDLIRLKEPSYAEHDDRLEPDAPDEVAAPFKLHDAWLTADNEPEMYPNILWLPFVKKVVLYASLKDLHEEWSKLPPDQKVTSAAAPELTPPVRKMLDQISDEKAGRHPAVQFLKAQLSMQSPGAEILPSTFLKALKALISEIRPERPITAEALFESLEKKGACSNRIIEDDCLFDTAILSSWADTRKKKTHSSLTISDCWFEGKVRLDRLPEGPAITFNTCFFAQGVVAKEAELGRELSFEECVFNRDVYQWWSSDLYALNLENARLRGNLVLWNCSLKGAFYAPRMWAGNHLLLIGCSISGSLENISEPATVDEIMERKWPKPEGEFDSKAQSTIEAVNLTGARIEGNLRISAAAYGRETTASVIDGGISCADLSVGQSLHLFGASFEKTVNFLRVKIAGYADLTLVRIFDGNLNFSNALLEDLSLGQANVNGDINLYHATISGNLHLLGLKTSGSIEMGLAKVRAFVAAYHTVESGQIAGLSVGRDLILSGIDARVLELRGAEITGKVRIITGKFGRLIMGLGTVPPKVGGDQPALSNVKLSPKPCRASVLEVTSIEVEENVDLSGLMIGLPEDDRKVSQLRMDHEGSGISLNNSKIGRDLTFFTERIRVKLERRWKGNSEQRLQWENIPFPHDYGAMVWGNLVLKANEIGGGLDMRHMNVTGDIYLNDTTVRFDVNMDAGYPNFDGFETRCNNLYAQKLDCSGDLKLSGLSVGGNFRARQAKVKGELVFLPSQIKEQLGRGDIQLEENSQASIGGDLDLSSVDVRGDLDLRNLKVQGDILINDTSVGLDLNLDGNSFVCFATTCNHLNAEGLRCVGEIKLSGLHAKGNFRGRDIQAGSGIAFLISEQTKEISLATLARIASIGGDIDLVGARANRLTLSGENLSSNQLRMQAGHSSHNPNEARVTLARAAIGNVEIVRPSLLGAVNLSGISVTQWAFSNCDEHDSEGSNVQNYIDVLKGLTPFDRSIWLDIEKLLRNQSEIGDANKIYREMRKKIRADKIRTDKTWWLAVKLFFWRVKDGAKSFTLGYGTRVWIPMIPALVFFILSIFIFSKPDYVRASPSLLQVLQTNQTNTSAVTETIDRAPNTVPGVNWTLGDSVALSLRYQVPIINALTHSWWEASGKPLFLGFTAEHYAFIMQIYHAVVWPIFLLGIAGQIIRGRQN